MYDIVDTQFHAGPGGIEGLLGGMNALGIASALIDEYWLLNANGFNNDPCHPIEGGVRHLWPTAELAAQMHPDRFGYVARIARIDPEYGAIVRMMADSPYCKAFRVAPGVFPQEVQSFAEGGYDHLFDAADEVGMPICVYLPERVELIARVAEKHPQLKIVFDHCGLMSNDLRVHMMGLEPLDERTFAELYDKVLSLSKYENVALKWSHVSENFDVPEFPGDGAWPYLRRAVNAFGADRIMWASDWSVNRRGESWGEILYEVKGNRELSEEEKALVLGGTARAWFNWPKQD